ncbi:MAG: hypothetical protein GXX84_19220 [Acidobacteria bacterium]|nr:hypothetical protein [Acidobacteriota bacterium]
MWLSNTFRSGAGIFSREVSLADGRLEFRLDLVLLVTWMLPALLSAMQGDSAARSFLSDSALHARSLVAVPILILGEYFSLPLLREISGRFRSLVSEDERGLFEAYLDPVRSFRLPVAVVIASIVCAYLVVLILLRYLPLSSISGWQRGYGDGFRLFSPGGWWNVLVNVPLVLSLVFMWIWRLFLWSRFLWQISRLRLQLIASHPDGMAGLRFLGYSPAALLPLSVALSAILAGMIADRVLLFGEPVMSYQHLLYTFAAVVIVLYYGPAIILTGKLFNVRRRGVVAYSRLANRVGRSFEEKWMKDSDASALEVPDFSATADLYHVVEQVYRMRVVPIDMKSLGIFITVTLIPFLPVILLQVPLKTIVQKIAALSF